MKAKVIQPFYDTCLHNKGDIIEVKEIDPKLMEAVEDTEPETDKPAELETKTKTAPKKRTTRKKEA